MSVISVTKEVQWDMGHRIPNHKSKCRNLHGHRYKLEARITAPELGRQGSSEGMVIDFGDLKDLLMEIHDLLDHKMLLQTGDKSLSEVKVEPLLDEEWEGFEGPQIWKQHQQDGGVVDHLRCSFVPTAENLVVWCAEYLRLRMSGSDYSLCELRLYETPTSVAVWACTV